MRCENLKLQLAQRADKSVYPSHIEADGSVLAGDETQQIKADSLRANLGDKIGQKGESQADLAGLKDLVAIGNVEMKSKEGDIARGQRIELRSDNENNAWVLLEGAPAYVKRGDSSLAGKLIEVNTATDNARVTGGGKMITAGKPTPRGAGGPGGAGGAGVADGGMELTWSGEARVDGVKDSISVQGDVGMKFSDDQLADDVHILHEAHGDRLEAVMARLPETQKVKPVKQVKQVKSTSTKPAKSDAKEFKFLAGRTVRQVTLFPAKDQEIQLQSLKMRGNYIDYQVNVFGPRLDCEFSPTITVDELGQKKNGIQLEKLLIPATPAKPSRMLYVSLPPVKKDAVKVTDPFKMGSLPGATAFSWTDRLTFDHSLQQFQMAGQVFVRHQPQLKTGHAFDILPHQTITGELDLSSKPQPSAGLAPGEVKRLLLTGQPVELVSKDKDQSIVVTSNMMEVHPGTGDVIARGTERNPVTLERGNVTQTVTQVNFNTETNDFHAFGGVATGRP